MCAKKIKFITEGVGPKDVTFDVVNVPY